MPFNFLNALSGSAAGWDNPSYGADIVEKRKFAKFQSDLANEAFKKRLSTARAQLESEEGEDIDDVAQAMVSRGDIDETTGQPMSLGAAYRKAKQTFGEAKAAEPLEKSFSTRLTSAKLADAPTLGKKDVLSEIAKRTQAMSDALLGSEQAESERPLVPDRARALGEQYKRGIIGNALARKTDEQRVVQGVPEATARMESLRDTEAAEGSMERQAAGIPRLTSAADASNLRLAYDTAERNQTLGVPGAESKARVAQAEQAEQEARQAKVTSKLEPSEASKLRSANAKAQQMVAEGKISQVELPLLARKFARAAQMDPAEAVKVLSDDEQQLYKYLVDTGALSLFIDNHLGIYRATGFNPLTSMFMGGGLSVPPTAGMSVNPSAPGRKINQNLLNEFSH